MCLLQNDLDVKMCAWFKKATGQRGEVSQQLLDVREAPEMQIFRV